MKIVSASLLLRRPNNKKKDIQIIKYIYIPFFKLEFIGTTSDLSNKLFLLFSFRELRIVINEFKFLLNKLHAADDGTRAFFYFIEIHSEYKSIAARGKGGGLAIWKRRSLIHERK